MPVESNTPQAWGPANLTDPHATVDAMGTHCAATVDVPQADRLATVRQVVEIIAAGGTEVGDIGAQASLSARHAGYYLHAARILGWLYVDGSALRLTQRGVSFLQSSRRSSEEAQLAAAAIASSAPIRRAAGDILAEDVDRVELCRRLIENTGLSQATALRRARTLMCWREFAFPDGLKPPVRQPAPSLGREGVQPVPEVKQRASGSLDNRPTQRSDRQTPPAGASVRPATVSHRTRRAKKIATQAEELALPTLEAEVEELLRCALAPEERAVLLARIAWDACESPTDEAVGRQLGLSSERVQEVIAGVVRHLRRHRRPTPRLRRTLLRIADSIPSTESQVDATLLEAGLVRSSSKLRAVADVAAMLGNRVSFIRQAVGDAVYVLPRELEDLVGAVLGEVRQVSGDGSTQTVSNVATQVEHALGAPVAPELIMELLRLQEGFRWVDQRSGRFALGG